MTARPRALQPDIVEATVDLGDRIAPLTARVNRRARRLILRVEPVEGRVFVTAPSRRALSEALQFAHARAAWIRDRLDEGLAAQPFVDGGLCPLRGVFHRIVNDGGPRAPVRQAQKSEPALLVGGAAEHLTRRLTDWLKREARRDLEREVERAATALGKTRPRIILRDPRTRWGSCSAAGVLSFSWRLIFAPSWVLNYVAAHECAHLVHLNHSPAYWRTLKVLNGDAEAAAVWFEQHGASLHAWGAGARPTPAG